MLVREITHAIETNTKKDLVLNFAEKNKEFKLSLEGVKQQYGTNEVSNEELADISGQLLGNQEFINSLSMENTTQSKSIIRNVYESIKKLLNNLTTEGRYKNFVQELETKWREAYRNTTKSQAINNLGNEVKFSEMGSNKIDNYNNIDYNNRNEEIIPYIVADPSKAKYAKYCSLPEFFELDVKEMDRITRMISAKAKKNICKENEKDYILIMMGMYINIIFHQKIHM